MEWSVFLWTNQRLEEADIADRIEMPNAEAALFEVMIKHQVPYASYAWAAPADWRIDTVEFYDVQCSLVKERPVSEEGGSS